MRWNGTGAHLADAWCRSMSATTPHRPMSRATSSRYANYPAATATRESSSARSAGSWSLEAGSLLRLRLHIDLQRSPQRVRDRALALRFARHFRKLRVFEALQSLCHDGEFGREQLDPRLGLISGDRCRHERTGRARLLPPQRRVERHRIARGV